MSKQTGLKIVGVVVLLGLVALGTWLVVSRPVWFASVEAPAPTGGVDAAKLLFDNIPLALASNDDHNLTLEFKNTGTSIWSSRGGYQLVWNGEQSFGGGTVSLDKKILVKPGESYVFKFKITAPGSPGNFLNSWSMSHNNKNFGDSASLTTEVARRGLVDSLTLDRKILWGYQGWFLGPSDRERPWGNWFNIGSDNSLQPSFDYWPDVSELDEDELVDTGLKLANTRPAYLYSAKNKKTVERHFKWLRDYDIDGVWVQRFIGTVAFDEGRSVRDAVLNNARSGAEKYGRVFGNMYDLSGINGSEISKIVLPDWKHLVDDLKITESSRYQKHNGYPVVAMYGFPTALGSEPTNYNGVTMPTKRAAALEAKKVLDFFHSASAYRATVFCSLPNYNRTGSSWQVADPDWKSVVTSCDIVGSWVVGNTSVSCGEVTGGHNRQFVSQPCTTKNADWTGFDSFFNTNYLGTASQPGDLPQARALGIDFMPHVYPGGSTYYQDKLNLGSKNSFSRLGGQFLWRQIYDIMNVFKKVDGVSKKPIMIYGSMFDEFNEGTQIIKTAARTNLDVPQGLNFIGFDVDPEFKPRGDFYLYLAGYAAKMLRGEIARKTPFQEGSLPCCFTSK